MQQLRTFALFFAVLLAAAPAVAQQPSPGRVRGYLIGGAGASLDPSTALTLSAEIAEGVGNRVQVYMSIGYYENVMSQEATDLIAAVGRDLTLLTGSPWQFTGRDRGRSFTVGGKVLPGGVGAVRPYIGAGAGVLNLRRIITERNRGDMTGEFLTTFGSGDGVVDPTQTNTNRPIGELMAGIGVTAGRAYVDFGYRYRKVFRNFEQSLNLSQVGVAVGVRF